MPNGDIIYMYRSLLPRSHGVPPPGVAPPPGFAPGRGTTLFCVHTLFKKAEQTPQSRRGTILTIEVNKTLRALLAYSRVSVTSVYCSYRISVVPYNIYGSACLSSAGTIVIYILFLWVLYGTRA